MFSSDFPHEVNTEKCLHHLDEIRESDALSDNDREAIMHANAERFYSVQPKNVRAAAE